MPTNSFNKYMDERGVSGQVRGELSEELRQVASGSDLDVNTLGGVVVLAAKLMEAAQAASQAEGSTEPPASG